MQKKYIAVILLLTLLLNSLLVGCSLFGKEDTLPEENPQQQGEQNEETKEITEPYIVWNDEGRTEYTVLAEDDPKVVEIIDFANESIKVIKSFDYRTQTLEEKLEDIYTRFCAEAIVEELEEENFKEAYEEYYEGQLVFECNPIEVTSVVFSPEYKTAEVYMTCELKNISATEKYLSENNWSLGEKTAEYRFIFFNNNGRWGYRVAYRKVYNK